MGKIVAIGEILVEIMATERGQSLRAPGLLSGPFASGAPAIFIDQVGRLGHPAAMIGCVGDDDFGWLNIERLRSDGVDIAGITFVTYQPSGERHFVFNIADSAAGRLSTASVTENLLDGCTRLHVMGSSLISAGMVEAVRRAITIVRQKGGAVSFDPNIRKEMLARPSLRDTLASILSQVDVFLPSGEETLLLAEASTEAAAVEKLLAIGVREIVVKRGRLGCTYFDACLRLDVPAFPVTEVDPTGAGDCFGATYLTCRDRGMPVEPSLRYACAAGALAVTRQGPMEGAAGWAELEALMAR
jgi:tagatose kinase